jgi:valyl-tRNA synthetase
MKLPKTYNPKNVEDKIYAFWEKTGFFNPDKLPGKRKKKFIVPIAPPNITGELHMGHALENILVDLLVRKARMEGKKVLWLPGIDHAGIATQNVVEKELKKEGKTRFDLGREKFIKRVWQWKEKYGNIILDQLKKLGCSLDWSRTRFTLDKEYIKAVEKAFTYYYKKGWIYLAEKTINWCPRCKTSLSDLEIVYKQKAGFLYYIKYGPLTIATTRPETKLGDTAIAVNPKDKRYKKYINKTLKIKTVLGPAKMKVIVDPKVDMNFGTGAMKVTPAHDLHDFELSKKYNLEKKQVIGPDGRMTKLAGKYEGLPVLKAREKIIADMKKINILVKTEPYTHNIAKCYRCDAVIEPILSKQLFLKMGDLSKKAIKVVKEGKVKFVPKNFEKIYFNWLKNIEDWCISRQIWWGHQLPVWQCQTGRISNLKCQMSNLKEEFFISLKKPKRCLLCKKCKPKQIEDVLDTWFSSALWPFAILGWPKACIQNQKCIPKKGSDLDKFYPQTLVSCARDIINLWIARMIFSGLEFMGKAPFSIIFVHPTILTKEGKRMSKSLGTGIDPKDLIEKYGADALRFGLIWQTTGIQDIRFDEGTILSGKKFCNKIWNAARFVFQQILESKIQAKNKKDLSLKKFTRADREILKALNKTIKSVNQDIEKFRFGQALQKLYHFFWHEFCDKYLETSKIQLKNKDQQKQTKEILVYVLFSSLKLLHLFLPFITEKIYQELSLKDKKKSLMIEKWPG